MRFFFKLVRQYPKQSFLVLVAMLFAGVAEGFGLSAMLPLLSTAIAKQVGTEQAASAGFSAGNSPAERMVSEIFETIGLPPTLEVFLTVIFFAIALKSSVLLIANIRVGYTVAQIATDLRLQFLRSLLVTRWEFLLRQPVGALTSVMGECGRSSKGFHCGAMMTSSAVQVMVYVGVAFLVSWKATLVALVSGSAIFFVLKRYLSKTRSAGERRTRVNKLLLRYFVDSLHSIKPIKAMAQENLAMSVLFKQTNKLNNALRKKVKSNEYLHTFQEPLRMVFLLIGFYVVLVVLHFPLANVMVLFFLVGRVLVQTGKIMEQYQKMVFFESGFWLVQEKLKATRNEREKLHGSLTPTFEKEIRFDRITFAYGDERVLQNVSLTFPAGMITAIVGPSGSGKTTMLDLIIGLLQPTQGQIWIDDIALTEIDVRKWRKIIGYVPQEIWLLHDTVLNNVILGDPDLNEDDATRALQAAGAWEFVQSMPKGINSTVGERGGQISGGQRQRIAIARALVRKPKLLILDEATTALDPENEKAICSTLAQLSGDLTILAISHQPAVLAVADLAFQIQNGAVVPVKKRHATTPIESAEDPRGSKREFQLTAKPENF